MLLVKNLTLPNNKTISLKLEEDNGYVLSGLNGTGKSLLLKCLANLYPLKVEEFIFLSRPLAAWKAESFRTQVLYIPSLSSSTNDDTVEDFLNIPYKLLERKGHHPIIEFEQYLLKWQLKGKKIIDLSSGEKQSLSFLRALSLNPKLLLLDEPFSHLAPERTKELETLLLNWRTQYKSCHLIVSHDPHQHTRLKAKNIEFSDLLIT